MNDPDIMKAIDNIDEAIIEEHLKKKSAINFEEKKKSDKNLRELADYSEIAFRDTVFAKEAMKLTIEERAPLIHVLITSRANVYKCYDRDFEDTLRLLIEARDTHIVKAFSFAIGKFFHICPVKARQIRELDYRNHDTLTFNDPYHFETIREVLSQPAFAKQCNDTFPTDQFTKEAARLAESEKPAVVNVIISAKGNVYKCADDKFSSTLKTMQDESDTHIIKAFAMTLGTICEFSDEKCQKILSLNEMNCESKSYFLQKDEIAVKNCLYYVPIRYDKNGKEIVS